MHPLFSNLFLVPEREFSSGGADKPATKSPVIRILRPGYICEIIRDPHTDAPLHHWLVQDCETNEIIVLGQSRTLDEADRNARAFLDDLRLRRAI